jgi:hypothetical protein
MNFMPYAKAGVPAMMSAVQLVGHGGFEALAFRHDIPVPVPGLGEVLIRVLAAGINNTDINTRIGWYSDSQEPKRAGKDGGWTGGRPPRLCRSLADTYHAEHCRGRRIPIRSTARHS